MTTLYKFTPLAYEPILSGGAYCPLILQYYTAPKSGDESKTGVLGQTWINYLKRINTAKAFKLIASAYWGPTKGYNRKGSLIWNYLVYPGPDNFVSVKEVITGYDGQPWGIIETLPINRIPSGSITHKSHPHLMHLVYSSNRVGTWSRPKNQPVVPIIGNNRYLPMKYLVKA